jgi:zinc transport system substrate-binding protein
MRLLLLIICLHASSLLAAPRVVTSVAPLQEITASLMAGVASPQSIVGDGASMHHFALRPSHMRLLQQADLVIWIDRHFEAGFAQIAQTLPRSASQLELLPALGIDDHDGHIWFSPQRLQQASGIIAARLIEIDPEHATRYRDNARKLADEIAAWREQLRLRLQRQPPRYITDHRFSSHFEADMGYAAIAAIHDQHDDHGGLGELEEIELRLRAHRASCLLTLEAAPTPLALELAKKYGLKVISLAAAQDDNSQSAPIVRRLRRFAAALDQCA